MEGALVELGIVPDVGFASFAGVGILAVGVAIVEITFFAEGVGEGILAGVVGVVVLLTAAVFGATVESLPAFTDPFTTSIDPLTVSVDPSATATLSVGNHPPPPRLRHLDLLTEHSLHPHDPAPLVRYLSERHATYAVKPPKGRNGVITIAEPSERLSTTL